VDLSSDRLLMMMILTSAVTTDLSNQFAASRLSEIQEE
jgi:hypothetical protein